MVYDGLEFFDADNASLAEQMRELQKKGVKVITVDSDVDRDMWRDVRVTNAEAKAFDRVLDQQISAIERVLLQIDRERMRDEAGAFVVALERDLIVPADFTPR